MFDILIVGGGAAGFYAAIHAAEADPGLKIAIVERGTQVLGKVKVSGGGRCNVTHAEFDPSELVKHYPRGGKELLGPFYTHGPAETMAFFEDRGVPLKIEADGRVFPVSNNSQSIIDLFLAEADRLGIKLLRHSGVVGIEPSPSPEGEAFWQVVSIKGSYRCRKLLIAAGGSQKIWDQIQKLGHSIVPPVPSLFTFNIQDPRIQGLEGISTRARVGIVKQKRGVPKVTIKLASKVAERPLLEREGPLLVTHWGMSGPAILKLSAWGAVLLHGLDYRFPIKVNWLPDYHKGGILDLLMEIKEVEAKKTVARTRAFDLPKRLWANLVEASGIPGRSTWAQVQKRQLAELALQLTEGRYAVKGKSRFKEEFVTAGGVALKEIDFKTFGSKICPNLYFAGEVIDVDAVTGGFNFQNAWTGAYIAAMAMAGD